MRRCVIFGGIVAALLGYCGAVPAQGLTLLEDTTMATISGRCLDDCKDDDQNPSPSCTCTGCGVCSQKRMMIKYYVESCYAGKVQSPDCPGTKTCRCVYSNEYSDDACTQFLRTIIACDVTTACGGAVCQ